MRKILFKTNNDDCVLLDRKKFLSSSFKILEPRLPHLESIEIQGMSFKGFETFLMESSQQELMESRSLVRSLSLREIHLSFGFEWQVREDISTKLSSLAPAKFIREVSNEGKTLEVLKLSRLGRSVVEVQKNFIMDDFMRFILYGNNNNSSSSSSSSSPHQKQKHLLPRLRELDLSQLRLKVFLE